LHFLFACAHKKAERVKLGTLDCLAVAKPSGGQLFIKKTRPGLYFSD
jgi:hypothetical protein